MKHLVVMWIFLVPIVISAVPTLDSISWDNPEFQARFLGSYGFDGPTEPSVTLDEQQVLQSLFPLLEAGKTRDAARRLREAMAPDSSAALDFTLGNLYQQNGDIALAETAYRKALSKHPGFVRAARNLGLMLARDGRFEKATIALRTAIERGDRTASTWGTLAYCHYQKGDFTAALEGYQYAAFLEPTNADWSLGRAQCLVQLERATEARAVAERFLQLDPAHVQARRVAINACLAGEDWERAAAHLEVLRRTQNADAHALLQLGRAYLAMRVPRPAVAVFTEAIRLPRKPPAADLIQVCRLLAEQGYTAESEALLAVVTAQYGETPDPSLQAELLLLRGNLLAAAAETEAAVALLEQALALNPLSGEATIALARIYRERGSLLDARIAYERATRFPEVAAGAWVGLAQVYVDLGEFEPATTALEIAQSIRPRQNVEQYLRSVRRLASNEGG